MEKIVYSLVLSKSVVQAVDELAAKEGKSRSAIINHILAEYTSVATPEKNMQNIIEAVQKNAYERFNTTVSLGGMLTLRTALRYKYNPAISYVVEIDSTPEQMGNLRVNTRTQNQELKNIMNLFFDLWNHLEVENAEVEVAQTQWDGAKQYQRILRQNSALQNMQQEGKAIAAYVNLLDDCMKEFFENASNTPMAIEKTKELYIQTVKKLEVPLP